MSETFEHQADVPAHPKIVIIGGGGGTSAVFPKIAEYTPEAVAVLGTSDSGGSSGRLAEQLDTIPPGDFRNVAQAASQNPVFRELRHQRFSKGDLAGHTLGNAIFAGCFVEFGFEEGLRKACALMQVPGRILPVTLTRANLVMEDGPGNIIHGEHEIDVYHTQSDEPRVWLEPAVDMNPEVAEAIETADLILIPGGSIYTSLLATLSANGVADALRAARAPVVMLSNLATEEHQTDNWHVSDFVLAMQRHGIDIDVVLYNDAAPTPEMLANYAAEGQKPVDNRPELFDRIPTVRAIGAALLSHEMFSQNPNDPIKRGLMRHDPDAVVRHLQLILAEEFSRRAARIAS